MYKIIFNTLKLSYIILNKPKLPGFFCCRNKIPSQHPVLHFADLPVDTESILRSLIKSSKIVNEKKNGYIEEHFS